LELLVGSSKIQKAKPCKQDLHFSLPDWLKIALDAFMYFSGHTLQQISMISTLTPTAFHVILLACWFLSRPD